MVDNVKVFGSGMAKAKAMIVNQLKPVYSAIARDLLFDAVKMWEGNMRNNAEYGNAADGPNMTGNTINSYMAGVYMNGKLFDTIYAWDVGVTDRPTARYSYPGDVIYTWHQMSMGIGPSGGSTTFENTGRNTIRQYKSTSGFKFQEMGRGSGIEDAVALLREFKTDSKEMLTIVVCVGVPYAEYLENVRKLDVLKANSDPSNVRQTADANFALAKSLE